MLFKLLWLPDCQIYYFQLKIELESSCLKDCQMFLLDVITVLTWNNFLPDCQMCIAGCLHFPNQRFIVIIKFFKFLFLPECQMYSFVCLMVLTKAKLWQQFYLKFCVCQIARFLITTVFTVWTRSFFRGR